jgi:hypothetical protein
MVAARPFLERTGHAALARTRKGLCFGTVLFSFVGSSRLAPVHVLVALSLLFWADRPGRQALAGLPMPVFPEISVRFQKCA